MADGKPASATIFYLPDQYRPFPPLLIAGEVFLFLVIRRNPLPPTARELRPNFGPP